MRKLLLAAAGIAATLALTQAPARASVVFTPTTFNGNQAVIDDTSHVTWVTPKIAATEISRLSALLAPPAGRSLASPGPAPRT